MDYVLVLDDGLRVGHLKCEPWFENTIVKSNSFYKIIFVLF